VYQIGPLEKEFERIYGSDWITKRPQEQVYLDRNNTTYKGVDQYDRKAEAKELREARANIRALTPPADEQDTREQIAA